MIKKVIPKEISLNDAWNMYLYEMKSKNLSKSSFECALSAYNLIKKDLDIDDNMPVSIMSKETISKWIDYLLNERHNKITSINIYLSHLRVFLYFCMRNGYLSKYKVSLLKHQEEMIKYYSDEDLRILIKRPSNSCSYSEYRTWVIICFILATGARASTVVNIKISDIDFDNKEVIYRHLKNKQAAILPLSDEIINILRRYLREWSVEDYLFCSVTGNKLTVSALRQGLNKYCSKRGIKSLGPHALRHSFARNWIKNGGGAFQLQKMLNHSDIAMTQKYVRLFSDDLHQDIKLYSPLDSIRQKQSRSIGIYRK